MKIGPSAPVISQVSAPVISQVSAPVISQVSNHPSDEDLSLGTPEIETWGTQHPGLGEFIGLFLSGGGRRNGRPGHGHDSQQVLVVAHNLERCSCRDHLVGDGAPDFAVHENVAFGIERLHG
jgi:hypothetical protein